MPARFLSAAELARLSGWPDEIADNADLITSFTLSSDDLGWLTSRVQNRLGAALHLRTTYSDSSGR